MAYFILDVLASTVDNSANCYSASYYSSFYASHPRDCCRAFYNHPGSGIITKDNCADLSYGGTRFFQFGKIEHRL